MKKVVWVWALWLMLTSFAWARDLPDFTGLVQKYGPTVVNITSTQLVKSGGHGQTMSEQDMLEFFRRFMPPGSVPDGAMPSPQQPQASSEVPVRSSGSGFIISPDGYILTNAHVVDGADEVTVKLTDRREFRAKVIGADQRSDVALIKINATNLPQVVIGKPDQIKVGEWVIAIGSPFGFENSVTAGIVSATGRALPNDNYVPFIQTDAAVNPGNSGGPLFNMNGEVIGINSEILSRSGGYMGLSFAIPIDVAMHVADQLKTQGKVSRGRLGVVIQEVNAGNADAFGLPKPTGALVSGVEKDSPAEKAGVKVGDVILKFGGKTINSSFDLPRLVAATKPGSKVDMEVWRNRALTHLAVTVGALPDAKTTASGKPIKSTKVPNKIGLVLKEMNKAQRDALGVSHGIEVAESRGIAARAGIQPGDVILAVSNVPVHNVAQFEQLLKGIGANKRMALLVKRGQDTVYIPLRMP
ncbi:MAG: DegQ family serine endoprotease [Sulfuriferula sp.]